jgi:hypothetical protein|tara:strand:+ start:306 stop:1094 length:789 start_codon:yes stop_codon:yes gene_type:complete
MTSGKFLSKDKSLIDFDSILQNKNQDRISCPHCFSYKSIRIRKINGMIKWECFDANCNKYGIYNDSVSMNDLQNIFTGKKEIKDDNYELPKSFFSPMTRNKPRNFMKKWNLNPSELDLEFRYDVKEDRFVFLIIHGGRIKGAIGRALYETKYRWKKYNACDYPFVCGVDNDMGVIVEDCISACRASSVATGVAIMGTSLSEPHKNYIEKNFKSVLICLDPDAKSKSFDIERQLSYNLDKRIVWIKQDLKYYRSDEIKNVLEV